MIKLLALEFLVLIFSCKPKNRVLSNTLHCIILEYTGEENKPIPVLIFCDSTKQSFDYEYYYTTILDNKMLNNLSGCIPKYTDSSHSSKTSNFPLYKIVCKYDKGERIIYIIDPNHLNTFADCIEKYITENDFYRPHAYIETVRAMNTNEKY